ncbi:hypothetical protein [Gimesia panareensis]|uniref:hypothetical protein n=1 Tax=Gimesia panareensis TaxID=2527978 RepID=UPI0011A3683C|nr:hypothetical protein [Gimesia panareensis]
MTWIYLARGNQAVQQKLFKELFDGHIVEWVLAVLLIIFLIWLIVWIVGRFRENEVRHVDARELLLQFAEMQREGDLTDDEFRSIKKRLVDSSEDNTEQTKKEDLPDTPAGNDQQTPG